MYHASAQGVDERMINVHYYYYFSQNTSFKNNNSFYTDHKQTQFWSCWDSKDPVPSEQHLPHGFKVNGVINVLILLLPSLEGKLLNNLEQDQGSLMYTVFTAHHIRYTVLTPAQCKVHYLGPIFITHTLDILFSSTSTKRFVHKRLFCCFQFHSCAFYWKVIPTPKFLQRTKY